MRMFLNKYMRKILVWTTLNLRSREDISHGFLIWVFDWVELLNLKCPFFGIIIKTHTTYSICSKWHLWMKWNVALSCSSNVMPVWVYGLRGNPGFVWPLCIQIYPWLSKPLSGVFIIKSEIYIPRTPHTAHTFIMIILE